MTNRKKGWSLCRHLVVTLLLFQGWPAQADNPSPPDRENPLVLGINKLAPRNATWPCPDAASGWSSHYDHSLWELARRDGPFAVLAKAQFGAQPGGLFS